MRSGDELARFLKNIRDFDKSLVLTEERHQRQEKTNNEIRAELSEVRQNINSLTTRVAVLEEGRKTIDADVRRVMTEVIADWERQHAAQENERLRAELAEAKRSRTIAE